MGKLGVKETRLYLLLLSGGWLFEPSWWQREWKWRRPVIRDIKGELTSLRNLAEQGCWQGKRSEASGYKNDDIYRQNEEICGVGRKALMDMLVSDALVSGWLKSDLHKGFPTLSSNHLSQISKHSFLLCLSNPVSASVYLYTDQS